MGFCDSVRSHLTQTLGFVVKVFLQRWRTPVTTVLEVLLPFIFMLFMGIAYWTTDNTYAGAAFYEGWDGEGRYDGLPLDLGAFAEMFICRNPASPYLSGYADCPGVPYFCMSTMYDGNTLCYTNPVLYTVVNGMKNAFFYGIAQYPVPSLDQYFAIMAMTTNEVRESNMHLFANYGGGRVSLSHYGSILLACDDAALAADFIAFCEANSAFCQQELRKDMVFTTHEAAEDYAIEHPNTVWAIVTLDAASVDGTPTPGNFTLSLNYNAVPSTNNKGSGTRLFSRSDSSTAGTAPHHRYLTSGFLTLQNFVFLFYYQRNAAALTPVNGFSVANASRYMNQYGPMSAPMPTVNALHNGFLDQWVIYVPLVACMAALFPVARLTAMIVEEKPNGIREAMLIMGLHPSCLFIGWYVTALIMDFVASCLVAMIIRVSFMQTINYGVLLGLYFSFMQQNTAFAFLVSAVFSNPRIACWVAAFLMFAFSIPAYTLPATSTALQKIFMCLAPCYGYGSSFMTIINYAQFHQPFNWSDDAGTYNVRVAIGMMWASFALMMVLAYYVERVLPTNVGRPAHPLFFIMPLVRLLGGGRPQPPRIAMTSRPRVCCSDRLDTKSSSGAAAAAAAAASAPLGSDSEGDLKEEVRQRSAQEGWIEHADEIVDVADPSVAAVFYGLRKTYFCGGIFGLLYTFFTGLMRKGDRVVALDDVTFAMKRGEVSVLLGVNGAGKSTIMGVATGMVMHDEGAAFVNGYSTATDLEECRRSVGYCPQRDIVWENLTVEEHLAFYARLKGFGFCVQNTVDEAIELLGLQEKRKALAGTLSGGQQRRLCVAIALVGDSKVLFMDEPTAGMDVRGRRTIYEALNRARADRSVLICTHLLDEADRIGDRVLLIHQGRVCAEGSTMYLKSQMNIGFVVSCVLASEVRGAEESAALARLVDFVKEHGYPDHREAAENEVQAMSQGCKLMGIAQRGREMSFRFPLSLLSTTGHRLLTELQLHQEELQLHSVTLNLTTLEDVFMTATGATLMRDIMAEGAPAIGACPAGGAVVAVAADEAAVEEPPAGETDALFTEKECVEEDFYVDHGAVMSFFVHFRALFLKRLHFAKRDWKQFIFQIFVPVVFLLLSLLVNLIRAPQPIGLTLDMSMYGSDMGDSEAIIGSTVMFDPYSFRAMFMPVADSAPGFGYKVSAGMNWTTFTETNATFKMSHKLEDEFFTHELPRLVAFCPANFPLRTHTPRFTTSILFNTSYDHTAPQSINALHAFVTSRLWGDGAKRITARTQPIRMGPQEREVEDINKRVLVGIFVILPFILLPCFVIGYVVRENETGARHMQWLSGANVLAYWTSLYVFDFACYLITCIISFAMFAIFNRQEYISHDTIGPSMVTFLFFGLSMIPFSYVLSFFFRSPFVAQTAVLALNFSFGFLWVTLESFLAESAFDFVRTITFISRVLPAVSLGESLYVLAGTGIALLTSPDTPRNLYKLLSITKSGGTGTFVGGVGTGLIYMGVVCVVSILLLVVFEVLNLRRRSLRNLLFSCRRDTSARGLKACDGDSNGPASADGGDECEDLVAAEEARVCGGEGGAPPEGDCIVLQHVTKQFPGMSRPAVADASFGVHTGEVMALLGLNGAGKSTAMALLTGEESVTHGRLFMNGTDAGPSRRLTGYCPQHDPLLDNLSVSEHLFLYARLRGMRERYIPYEVQSLIDRLGLGGCRWRPAYALSGGNKRRLCLAIAMVGRTRSVLLDEPTSGMDVVARAHTCAMIKALTADRSVVLTTHLLEEADALAHRCTIMARGRVRCVGTPHELRTRYTHDSVYTMHVLFGPAVSFSDERREAEARELLERVTEHVRRTMRAGEGMERDGSCDVVGAHNATLVLSVRGHLPDVCRALADLQDGNIAGVPAASYASVTQPTLEDILLAQ